MTETICNIIIRFDSLRIATIAYRIARMIDPTESTIAAAIRDTARDNFDDFAY